MKTLYGLVLLFFISTFSFGQLLMEPFLYSNGDLTTVSGGNWTAFSSGGSNPVQVTSNAAVITHSSASSEDVRRGFTAQNSGSVYYGIIFSVDDLGAAYSGSDNEFFFHLRDGATQYSKMDIVAPSGGGDYSVGIATSASTADATWATDLTFGTDYVAMIQYDIDNDQSRLWIDPASEASTNITGADEAATRTVDEVCFRQSDSSEDETIRVKRLAVGTNFTNVLNSLPVEYITFEAEKKGHGVELNWQTALEINNRYFSIERDNLDNNFEEIGQINGAGTSFEITNYSFFDDQPKAGINRYRLKQVDFDGSFSYSPIVSVDFRNNNTIDVFPNPVSGILNIQLKEPSESNTLITVSDFSGKIVSSFTEYSGQTNISIDLEKLPAGSYLVQIQTDNFRDIQRFVKQGSH